MQGLAAGVLLLCLPLAWLLQPVLAALQVRTSVINIDNLLNWLSGCLFMTAPGMP